MKALLSIKPEFVDKIRTGEKLFEYRKAVFKRQDVKSVVIYSTMPEGKIIGEFEIGEIIKSRPSELWEATKDSSGINKAFFDKYFSKKEVAYAIEIIDFREYVEPIDPYIVEPSFKAPQSFKYISSESIIGQLSM